MSCIQTEYIKQKNSKYTIAVVAIDRSRFANSFNKELMQDLSNMFISLKTNPNVRALVIYGIGKHFSAGADLNWMKDSAELDLTENIIDAESLTKMFESLQNLDLVTIAAVHGCAFGGALGLIAACDYSIAADDAVFCLSEVKLGLIPAVIMPYLARKIPRGDLKRLMLTGVKFDAKTALRLGLIQQSCKITELESSLNFEIDLLLQGGPQAQQAINKLYSELDFDGFVQSEKTKIAIANTRISSEAQTGLNAFFANKTVSWCSELEKKINLEIKIL